MNSSLNQDLLPWHWRSLPLAGRQGSEVFECLFYQDAIATLLESPAACGPENLAHSRYSICAGGPRTIAGQLQLWTPPRGEIFSFLRSRYQLGQQTSGVGESIPPSLPFQGGWLGWLGYGAAWEIESLPSLNADPLPFPDAYWYEPECFAVLDHQSQILWLAASKPTALDVMEQKLQTLESSTDLPLKSRLEISRLEQVGDHVISFMTDQSSYMAMVEKAKHYIRQGDIFQTNLSLRFSTETRQDPWQIYRHLHRINPSPFASFWRTPWGGMASCSPERLVQLKGRQAQTRPIAGTRPRGADDQQNRTWAQELQSNRKENAEHIMLVDLERNDLGRVCEWGTVKVNELCVIESYSHVMHLVSNVMGTLRPGTTGVDLLQASFPGGTITGCPKVRCMEIIEELEPVQRSLFYGSCGFLDYRGDLDMNILIRTLLYNQPSPQGQRTIWGQVGAGIVADSQPEQEWLESLQKAKALFAVL